MIVPLTDWRVVAASEGPAFVDLRFTCHVLSIRADWVDAAGLVNGGDRLTCTYDGCRRAYERVVLEGWEP